MKIAILGTGTMGKGMAQGYLNAGHEVIVYNRTIEKTEELVKIIFRRIKKRIWKKLFP